MLRNRPAMEKKAAQVALGVFSRDRPVRTMGRLDRFLSDPRRGSGGTAGLEPRARTGVTVAAAVGAVGVLVVEMCRHPLG